MMAASEDRELLGKHMGWLVAVAAILFLMAGTALAYVIGAGAVLAFLATDNGRYLAVLPQRIFA